MNSCCTLVWRAFRSGVFSPFRLTRRSPATLLKVFPVFAGSVFLYLAGSNSVSHAASAVCAGRNATIIGTSDREVLYGTSGPDVIVAFGGNDVINGMGGNDVICGGYGNDTINGGDGADELYGEQGDDTLNGIDGNDLLAGAEGDDTLNGGDGNDVLHGSGGNDTLNAGDGGDTLNGGDGDDLLNGGSSADFLNGSDGNDSLNGQAGNDFLRSGNGDDVLRGGAGIDEVTGGPGNDILRGGSERDVLYGGSGDDSLYGDGSDDSLDGEDGDDRVFGGYGDDTTEGGNGDDLLNGGPGKDALNGSQGADTLDWFYPESDTVSYLATNDVVNMEWLPDRGPSDFSAVVPIYGRETLKYVRTVLRPQLRPGDILVLTSGNVTGDVDIEWVNRASRALHREFPDNPIMLLASGVENMKKASRQISGPVDAILYGYEPNLENQPEFSWDFADTAVTFSEVSDMLRSEGFQAGGYPTGRPVLQKTASALGWIPYGWHYGWLKSRMDWLMVQTQTYCVDSVSRYANALDIVGQDLAQMGHSQGWYPQVTIAPADTNTNSVSVERAMECTQQAISRGLPGIMVWWSPRFVGDMAQYLEALGRPR